MRRAAFICCKPNEINASPDNARLSFQAHIGHLSCWQTPCDWIARLADATAAINPAHQRPRHFRRAARPGISLHHSHHRLPADDASGITVTRICEGLRQTEMISFYQSMIRKRSKFVAGLLALSGFLFSAVSNLANIPGGGTGTGPNVTVTDNGNGTVTMANGVLSILITKNGASVNQMNYLKVWLGFRVMLLESNANEVLLAMADPT